MNNRDKLIEIIEDTSKWCRENGRLRSAVQNSIAGTKVYVPVPLFHTLSGIKY